MGLSIGPDFQKSLKVEIIPCTLMNKLQLGSFPKINCFMQNWHQLENLSNFTKAMIGYSLNSAGLFKAKDLFESGNMTHVLVSLLALAGKVKTKGPRPSVDISIKHSEKQERNFGDTTMKADQCVIGFQMCSKKCASPVGMTAPRTQWHISDTKLGTNKCDNSSMSLQMGYMQDISQSGQVFGLGWHI
ncbi:calponin-2-like [Pteronotus mesoamericanus]|uniref:calponin-2-like n=1 Tax=Pteronotus mesoamericanus TaxID=1884717 RepID=UPI0023EB2BF1|nr:calponin-2-like [Pteronotus parnellii mesoamericanus]